MKVYYAHFMGIYNTPQEVRDINTLTSLGFTVINPNIPEIQKEVNELKGIMSYMEMFDKVFFSRVKNCEIFAFRGLPDGRIPGGVFMELKIAQENKKIIIELPCNTLSRGMNSDETKEYLRDIGNR